MIGSHFIPSPDSLIYEVAVLYFYDVLFCHLAKLHPQVGALVYFGLDIRTWKSR